MKALFSAATCASILLAATVATAQHFPSMVYSAKQTIAPGVTHQTAQQSVAPSQRIHIFEIDMTNPNIELRPVFKKQGDVGGSLNETTSQMALRSDGVAAINAGYYNVTSGSPNIRRTNSFTLIDGIYIGGSSENANLAENNRSVLGFSGGGQSTPIRTKLTGSTGLPNPANPDWNLITDGIAGRGHFTWNGTTGPGNYTVDNEGTGVDHHGARHPRTAIGYSTSPYRVFLVAVDGRTTIAQGMTYDELGRFMADLGAEQSISLDGGGSTTAWTRTGGVLNVPTDGSERAVVSAWVVVVQNTMDNTGPGVTVNGTWTTDTAATDLYHIDQLVTDDGAGPASVEWRPDLGQAGEYRVYAWWTADAGRATAVPYVIEHQAGTSTVTIDQTKGGGGWFLLGHYPFSAGTTGSVTIDNSATGTVSADAIRFVRHRDIPPPHDSDYEVVSTVFQTDFETNQSGNFTIAQHSAGDNSSNFSFDYSTFAQVGGGFPQAIPPAPQSAPGATRALRVATNLANGAVNGITATLNSTAIPTPPANMRITFDAWINYNGGMDGGTGSTEFLSFGASSNGAQVASANSGYTSAANQPFSGFYFAMAGEGGAAADFRYYYGNNAAAVGNNGTRANFLGAALTENTQMSPTFPLGAYETNGAPGKAWHTWEILVLNGQVRLAMIRPDGAHTIFCNWFNPGPIGAGILSSLRPHLGTFDPFSSLANPGSDNFVLYDNLKVEEIQEYIPASLNNDAWTVYH